MSTKIRTEQITFGPRDREIDPFVAHTTAAQLKDMGYRGISNAYCRVARVDRDDWLDVLARERRCSRADFYNVDGSGIGDQHIDFYVRVHTEDKHTVHPDVYQQLKKFEL